ncbi:MAG: hypothetical protein ABFS34_12030 [Gemmatimonadota bacterium]
MRSRVALCAVTSLALLVPADASPQIAGPEPDGGPRIITYAKWGALGAAVTAGILGFQAHNDADRLFDDLEAVCEVEIARCAITTSGGYADPALESRFQEVLDADGRARTALILSQVAVATSLALFLLDLGGDSEPDNVPYDPDSGFGLRHHRDGRAELVYVLPFGGLGR